MSETYPPTALTSPTRKPDRLSYDRAAVHAVLDEGFVCHVGFLADGDPVVLPHLYARVEDRLYLHGSTAARLLRSGRGAGIAVCVTVTLVDGLVLARSGFNHSVNYRSVVAHGTAELVEDGAEKRRALDALVDAVVPGRAGHIRPPTDKELAATAVLRLDLATVSLKARTGDPIDEPDDLDLPCWAGVLPLTTVAGPAIPAGNLDESVEVPSNVTAWQRRGQRRS